MENEIGNRIREARHKTGMSQEKLAAAAGGRNVTQINAYERGRSRPSPRVLGEIAQALGVTPEELLGNPTREATDSSVASLLADFRRRMSELTGLPETRIRISIELS